MMAGVPPHLTKSARLFPGVLLSGHLWLAPTFRERLDTSERTFALCVAKGCCVRSRDVYRLVTLTPGSIQFEHRSRHRTLYARVVARPRKHLTADRMIC